MQVRGRLFNCAVVMSGKKILGAVPKVYMPNYNEYYEKRWFASGYDMPESVMLLGCEVQSFARYGV